MPPGYGGCRPEWHGRDRLPGSPSRTELRVESLWAGPESADRIGVGTVARLDAVGRRPIGGIVVGTVFGVVVAAAMASQGLTVMSIPCLQIGALVVFGAIAGLVAALFPARRAARLRILDAIAYE